MSKVIIVQYYLDISGGFAIIYGSVFILEIFDGVWGKHGILYSKYQINR